MSLDNPLFIGVLLIVVGLAFALFAYAIFLNRGGGEENEVEQETELDGESSPLAEDEEAIPQPAAVTAEAIDAAGEAPALEPTREAPVSDPYLEQVIAGDDPIPAEPAVLYPATVPQPEAPVEAAPATALEPSPVAVLLRDKVTGSLIVKVGEQVYRRPGEITDPADKRSIEFAAIDLASWFAVEMNAGAAARPEPGGQAQPVGMVAQINLILERNLAESGMDQAVRLIDDSSGGVKVLIGLQTFELEDVPDQQIKQMIRTSVAEWEASQ